VIDNCHTTRIPAKRAYLLSAVHIIMIVTYADLSCIIWHVIVLYVMENLIFDKTCTNRVNHAVDLMGVHGRHF
jgi:hypothetical protein